MLLTMSRTPTAASSSSSRQWSRGGTPSTASTSGRSTQTTNSNAVRVEYEVEPRVRHIEQQLQETLPQQWREFAGKPMQIQYYDKTINTFRENDHVVPSESYMRGAVKELRRHLEQEKLSVFTDTELREIVLQEWRTDMTRAVWQTRLNRHNSKDGPVVRRSRSGVITVTTQPRADEKMVIDALAQDRKSPTKKVRF